MRKIIRGIIWALLAFILLLGVGAGVAWWRLHPSPPGVQVWTNGQDPHDGRRGSAGFRARDRRRANRCSGQRGRRATLVGQGRRRARPRRSDRGAGVHRSARALPWRWADRRRGGSQQSAHWQCPDHRRGLGSPPGSRCEATGRRLADRFRVRRHDARGKASPHARRSRQRIDDSPHPRDAHFRAHGGREFLGARAGRNHRRDARPAGRRDS